MIQRKNRGGAAVVACDKKNIQGATSLLEMFGTMEDTCVLCGDYVRKAVWFVLHEVDPFNV